MVSIQDKDRAIILDDGSHHYGLIRTPQEKTFAATYSLDLPVVDISALPDNQKIVEWLRIEDQKQQGSCAAQARTSSQEVAVYRGTQGQVIQLSRQYAYIDAQKIDNIRGDQGSTIEGNAKSAQKGTPLEEFAPYTGQYYTQFSAAAIADAPNQKLNLWQRLRSYDDVLRWIVHGIGGVAIGIGWNSSCAPDSRGCIEAYRSGGGGHSLALLDWNKKIVDTLGRPYIDMFNSWGLSWGYKGRAFVHPKVVDYWCQNETVIGYSDMTLANVTPRPFDWIKNSFYSAA